MSKAGITVAIKGEINDLEAKITQSKEIINKATSDIINKNQELKDSQKSLNEVQKTYTQEIQNANSQSIREIISFPKKSLKYFLLLVVIFLEVSHVPKLLSF